MRKKLLALIDKHPLMLTLLSAVLLKLVAAIWTDGYIFDNKYFNYYKVPEVLLSSPWIVFVNRLIFGAFSLLIITIGYRIVKIISDRKTALEIAILLAFYWFMPYVTVHPLPQMVCIPFLLYGTLLIVKQDYLLSNNDTEKFHRTSFIIAGFFLGLGFAAWYQCILFCAGILIALMVMKNRKGALMTAIGFIIAVCITQIIPDLFIWHRPFVNMMNFFRSSGEYLSSFDPIVFYECNGLLYVIIALLIPMNILLLFGFFRMWRKHLLIFLPTFLFLLFYMIFPNPQPLYILPVLPFLIISGYIGWKDYYKNSKFWDKKYWLLLTIYLVFVVLNISLMVATFVLY